MCLLITSCMPENKMIKLVLFDFDGTLADTAPDLGLALNIQLERHGRPMLPDAAIRPYASHGARGLVGLGFGITPEDDDFLAIRDEYLAIYDEVFTHTTELFQGVATMLSDIESKGMRWGVVTNKPRRFTAPLMKKLSLDQGSACLVCGDDVLRVKPYPDSLFKACEIAGRLPAETIYVGDAERDIQAGKAAGMKTVIAAYGYIDASDTPQLWGANDAINQPDSLCYSSVFKVMDVA